MSSKEQPSVKKSPTGSQAVMPTIVTSQLPKGLKNRTVSHRNSAEDTWYCSGQKKPKIHTLFRSTTSILLPCLGHAIPCL